MRRRRFHSPPEGILGSDLSRMKRLVILILLVVAVIGGAIAAAPFIAATDLAKRRIATQIEEWTGHPVTFVGEPRVKLFPFLSLTIDDVRLGSAPGRRAADTSSRWTSSLAGCACCRFLIGRAEVAEFQLVRPHFAFTVDADGSRNWIGKRSSIAAGDGEDVGGTPRQIAEIKLGRFRLSAAPWLMKTREPAGTKNSAPSGSS